MVAGSPVKEAGPIDLNGCAIRAVLCKSQSLAIEWPLLHYAVRGVPALICRKGLTSAVAEQLLT